VVWQSPGGAQSEVEQQPPLGMQAAFVVHKVCPDGQAQAFALQTSPVTLHALDTPQVQAPAVQLSAPAPHVTHAAPWVPHSEADGFEMQVVPKQQPVVQLWALHAPVLPPSGFPLPESGAVPPPSRVEWQYPSAWQT
jgi:hypothetical protein